MNKVGKSLCVYSPKGGTGKTIISMNLAGVASCLGKKVLLIDLNAYSGSLSMIINDNIEKSIYNLTEDLVNNRFKNVNDYIYNYKDLIDVIPSPKDPRLASKINPRYIDILLSKIINLYDLIIVDTDSSMSDLNIITMDSVDYLLFVINNDLFTLKNTRNIINIFNDCNINNYRVLLNDSIEFKTPYFSITDMKKIIGANIDYNLSRNLFIKDITAYLYDCKIPSLIKGFSKKYKDDYNTLSLIISDLYKEEKNEKD